MNKKLKGISVDLAYSIAALVVLNATIQLIIYPQLTNRLGDAAFGDLLTVMSVVSIVATSFGSAANYSRMFTSVRRETCNGDYNMFLLAVFIVSLPVGLWTLNSLGLFTVWGGMAFAGLLLSTLLRYYADVEFRMKLNYKSYFIFYTAIALGYIAGLFLLPSSQGWMGVFVLGECAALLYSARKSSLFHRPLLATSPFFRDTIQSLAALSAANLLSSVVLNADRIIIRYAIGPAEVTVFYAATLIGKVIAMVGTPLNGVLVGYLTKYKGEFSRKLILITAAACTVVAVAAVLGCWVGSVIMIPLLYPDVYVQAKPLFWAANAGQVFYFISNTLMVLIMRMKGERISLWISGLHAAMFAACVIPATWAWGLNGAAISLLAINFIKFIVILAIGFFAAKK